MLEPGSVLMLEDARVIHEATPHLYEATIRLCRDTLGPRQLEEHAPSVCFEFGADILWIDCVVTVSHAGIEELPEGLRAFWVSSLASIVHLVCEDGEPSRWTPPAAPCRADRSLPAILVPGVYDRSQVES